MNIVTVLEIILCVTQAESYLGLEIQTVHLFQGDPRLPILRATQPSVGFWAALTASTLFSAQGEKGKGDMRILAQTWLFCDKRVPLRTHSLFKEIIAENFPNLEKELEVKIH